MSIIFHITTQAAFNEAQKTSEYLHVVFSGHTKADEIGGQNFNELAYDWSSMSLGMEVK